MKHEEFDYFRTGNVKVTVKVDFVSKMQNGTIVLSDWKTGADNDENETELQMAIYVLWAMQYYNKSLDEIQSESVFLKNGKTKPYLFFEEQLREVQKTIKMEYEAMNVTYDYNNYPAMPNPQRCLSCQFARICSDSGMGK